MIRVLFFGTHDFGLPALEAIRQDGRFTVIGAVTQPDRPAQRGKQLKATLVSDYCRGNNIDCYKYETLKSETVALKIKELQPDVFLVAAYGLIIPKNLLDLVPRRSINIHGSLLPKYRGASPVAASIMNGDKITGVSIMVMTPRLDDGDVLAQYELKIDENDNQISLMAKLAKTAAAHTADVVADYLADKIAAKPQDEDAASNTHKISKEDGRCGWQDADLESRRARAYFPWPGSWTTWNGKRLKILAGRSNMDDNQKRTPGTVIADQNESRWAVVCQRGIFIPTMIQLAGKNPQPAVNAVGWPGFVGSVLGS